jgi:hypothetical protein
MEAGQEARRRAGNLVGERGPYWRYLRCGCLTYRCYLGRCEATVDFPLVKFGTRKLEFLIGNSC